MANADEEMIEELNQYKKGSYGDMEHGYYIREEFTQFKRYSFFDGKMSVMLPENFIDLPETIVKLKYPSEQRPKVIKSSQDGGINFTFNLVDEVTLEEENVEYITESMSNGIKSINPAVTFGEKGIVEVSGTKLSWFEFQSNAFDGIIYNIMYCIPINGKMMHGVFNCLVQDMDAWKKIAMAVMDSIQDESSKEG